MNTQDIKGFVENIKKNKTRDNAFIGFYYDEEDYEGYTSYIKANRDGLILYASEILQASLKMENRESDDDNVFRISNDLILNYSDFKMSHVEFCDKSKAELDKPKKTYKETWRDKLGGYVVASILIFILISILVGVVTIISWFFK